MTSAGFAAQLVRALSAAPVAGGSLGSASGLGPMALSECPSDFGGDTLLGPYIAHATTSGFPWSPGRLLPQLMADGPRGAAQVVIGGPGEGKGVRSLRRRAGILGQSRAWTSGRIGPAVALDRGAHGRRVHTREEARVSGTVGLATGRHNAGGRAAPPLACAPSLG